MTAAARSSGPDASLVHVETTMESESAAQRLIEVVLQGRMAACAWLLPLRSKYWWKGRIEDAHEFLVVFKTAPQHKQALLAAIEENHPYEVPYIASAAMGDVPQAYVDWVGSETSTGPR